MRQLTPFLDDSKSSPPPKSDRVSSKDSKKIAYSFDIDDTLIPLPNNVDPRPHVSVLDPEMANIVCWLYADGKPVFGNSNRSLQVEARDFYSELTSDETKKTPRQKIDIFKKLLLYNVGSEFKKRGVEIPLFAKYENFEGYTIQAINGQSYSEALLETEKSIYEGEYATIDHLIEQLKQFPLCQLEYQQGPQALVAETDRLTQDLISSKSLRFRKIKELGREDTHIIHTDDQDIVNEKSGEEFQDHKSVEGRQIPALSKETKKEDKEDRYNFYMNFAKEIGLDDAAFTLLRDSKINETEVLKSFTCLKHLLFRLKHGELRYEERNQLQALLKDLNTKYPESARTKDPEKTLYEDLLAILASCPPAAVISDSMGTTEEIKRILKNPEFPQLSKSIVPEEDLGKNIKVKKYISLLKYLVFTKEYLTDQEKTSLRMLVADMCEKYAPLQQESQEYLQEGATLQNTYLSLNAHLSHLLGKLTALPSPPLAVWNETRADLIKYTLSDQLTASEKSIIIDILKTGDQVPDLNFPGSAREREWVYVSGNLGSYDPFIPWYHVSNIPKLGGRIFQLIPFALGMLANVIETNAKRFPRWLTRFPWACAMAAFSLKNLIQIAYYNGKQRSTVRGGFYVTGCIFLSGVMWGSILYGMGRLALHTYPEAFANLIDTRFVRLLDNKLHFSETIVNFFGSPAYAEPAAAVLGVIGLASICAIAYGLGMLYLYGRPFIAEAIEKARMKGGASQEEPSATSSLSPNSGAVYKTLPSLIKEKKDYDSPPTDNPQIKDEHKVDARPGIENHEEKKSLLRGSRRSSESPEPSAYVGAEVTPDADGTPPDVKGDNSNADNNYSSPRR